ncbi:LysR family transcriptional regulator [Yersinia enterocolitica]|uniref:LysR family transcriptional regulator n=1 Tax=Yersinia TaxID=629 RepID=UPI002DD424F1|nr:LysR family transcriptional regulator [Yersinia enterocolitica]
MLKVVNAGVVCTMHKQFDYNLIKFLVAVVDARSMSSASEKLDMAPSGISHAIGKLREYYKISL